MMLLAGDIGGTNTRLICVDQNGTEQHILAEKRYHSTDYPGLIPLLDHFLSEHHITETVFAVCMAVAGPVQSGIAAVTNLPWLISESELSQHFHIPRVKLINDFTAVVYGISELDEKDILMLHQGTADNTRLQHPDAAVIGAGTGLGVAHRVWLDDHYQAFSSEAGHVGFSPENEQQSRLLAWLQQTHAHVSLEMLLSGRGLQTIYQFLSEVDGLSESENVKTAIAESADPAQVITNYAHGGIDPLCDKTLDCFTDIYAAAAGNVALYYYPVDELYIAGGIGPKIKNRLSSQRFLDAFTSKGLMSSNMQKLRIKLVLQDKVGLYGALSRVRKLWD